jgi:hypothetical protein
MTSADALVNYLYGDFLEVQTAIVNLLKKSTSHGALQSTRSSNIFRNLRRPDAVSLHPDTIRPISVSCHTGCFSGSFNLKFQAQNRREAP